LKQFGYDDDGNVTTETTTGFAQAGTQTYHYNDANQLDEWDPATGSPVTYAYDGAGNRTQAGSTTYTYNAQNQLTSDGTLTYTWDLRGALASTSDGTTTTNVTVDAFGLETQNGTTSYSYDGLGRIAQRNGTGAWFAYNALGIDPIADGTWTTAQQPDGTPLSLKTGTTSTWALVDVHHDLIGLAAADASTVTESSGYDPYGQVADHTGSTAPTAGFQSDWTDPDTTEVWMGARFYQPANDTFTSRDTTNGTLASPLTLNRYTYANDN
jgi:RHS repeat-associated protein